MIFCDFMKKMRYKYSLTQDQMAELLNIISIFKDLRLTKIPFTCQLVLLFSNDGIKDKKDLRNQDDIKINLQI